MMFIWCFLGNAIVTTRDICVLEGLARMKMQWGDMVDSSNVSHVVSLERAECWVLWGARIECSEIEVYIAKIFTWLDFEVYGIICCGILGFMKFSVAMYLNSLHAIFFCFRVILLVYLTCTWVEPFLSSSFIFSNKLYYIKTCSPIFHGGLCLRELSTIV